MEFTERFPPAFRLPAGPGLKWLTEPAVEKYAVLLGRPRKARVCRRPQVSRGVGEGVCGSLGGPRNGIRSEERRVGKEARSRRSPYH